MKPVWFFVAAAILAALYRKREDLEPTLKVGGLLAAVGCIVYGTGVVHLPKIDKLLEDVGQALGPWTYLLVGVMAFLETGAFVGLLAPGETVILVGGVVAGQGQIDIVALIAIIWACAVAGDMTSFFIGRKLGRDFLVRHGPKVQITEPRIKQTEDFFDKHGGKAIFLGRFIGLVRAVAPFLAGSSGMPLRRFAPYDILGAGLWGTTFALLGFFFWRSIDRVLQYAKTGSLALGTTIVLGTVIVFVVRRLRDDEQRAQLIARLDAIPVVGRLARRLARPARFAWNRLTPGDLGLELTTLLTVAAVGSFVCIGYAISLHPGGELTPGDMRGLQWADDIRTGWLIDVAKAVTTLGSLPVTGGLVFVTCAVLVWRKHGVEAVALAGGMILTVIGSNALKALEDRPRPPHPLVETSNASYPSGHSAYAVAWVAVTIVLLRALPRTGARVALLTASIFLAVAIGLSRIELRAHYFSDVAGGWGLGATMFSLCAMVALIVVHLRQNSLSTS
ncbi:MAG: phosphoesterase PA-phosphatase related protein [Frankiales bacterium]|nr:phosphoesterase PA-phosphatase related protein [Frankiales bacterium]MCW3013083.1 phosphoesterase PA-phosphatase related protein [Solirubrobacterales bacterium]